MPKISDLRVGDVVRAHGSSGHVIRKDWSPSEGDYAVVEMSDGLHTITDYDHFTASGGGRKRRSAAKRSKSTRSHGKKRRTYTRLRRVRMTAGRHRSTRHTAKEVDEVLMNSPAGYRTWVAEGRPHKEQWMKLAAKWAREWNRTGNFPIEH